MKGWNFYGDVSLVESAPATEGKLELFTLGKYVTDDELQKEYDARGLTPAHPDVIAEYVLANPDFAEKYVSTHWKDGTGMWCFAAFGRWRDGRYVSVDRGDGDWRDGWWFAGLRKSSALATEPSSGTLSLELRLEKLERLMEKAVEIIPSITRLN